MTSNEFNDWDDSIAQFFTLKNLLNDAKRLQLLTFAADELQSILTEETQRGVFVNGQNKQYSAGYAKERAKRGRQTSFVDMTFTGGTVQRSMTKSEDVPTMSFVLKLNSRASKLTTFNKKRYDWFAVNAIRQAKLYESTQNYLNKLSK